MQLSKYHIQSKKTTTHTKPTPSQTFNIDEFAKCLDNVSTLNVAAELYATFVLHLLMQKYFYLLLFLTAKQELFIEQFI